MLKPILLVLGGLSVPLLLVAQPSPAPPLCRVVASAALTYVPGTGTPVPGIYDVTIRIRPDLPCPPGGRAHVRVESGRVYPWREILILPDQPAVYLGVPWYWQARWRAASGKTYRVNVPGLNPPWSQK